MSEAFAAAVIGLSPNTSAFVEADTATEAVAMRRLLSRIRSA